MPWWRKSIVGLLMGFASGLLSVGGGAVAVPAQQVILKMPLRSAIATSAAAIVFVGTTSAILKNALLGGHGNWVESLKLAAILTPTAMAGSYLGGHLTHKLPVRWVRLAFVALMLVSAWQMFVR